MRITITVLFFSLSLSLDAQNKSDTISDWDRTFMPAIQIGYVGHASSQLSGGLMTQTSIEYRAKKKWVFRVNYDDFKANMDVPYPLNPDLSFSGRMSFFEFIGGIGFRDEYDKHILTGYVQGGIRNYGFPNIITDQPQAQIDYKSQNVGIMRYSLGYEFALTPKLFFTIEGLATHTLKSNDFWEDNPWSFGGSIGLTAPLF